MVLITVICWLFTFGSGVMFITLKYFNEQTYKKTSELSATIEAVEITNIGDETYVEIFTKEYQMPLYITTNVMEYISTEKINNLQKNQTISFRAENSLLEQLDEMEFLNIVSLETDNEDIFSLSDYNTYIYHSSYSARVACIIVLIFFLTVSIFCTIKIACGK